MEVDLDLTAVEARVLGCLVEKEATTPDVYPLTTNALVTACNQKTNRDPVVAFSAVDVDGALLSLRQKGLVRAVHMQGNRSTKHRQVLAEAAGLSHGQLAVLAVLMLRGPQTVGELRGRTERIHEFTELADVDRTLLALADFEPALTQRLERAPGQKEARWQQLMSPTDVVAAPAPVSADAVSTGAGGVATPSNDEVAELRRELDELRTRFEALCERLGESPEA